MPRNTLFGYGMWKMKTPQNFDVANKVTGNVLIIFAFIFLGHHIIEEYTKYVSTGIERLILTGVLALTLFISINVKLNKMDSKR